MPSISDAELIQAWTQVLDLSDMTTGQSVTVLTSSETNRQTMRCAIIAAGLKGLVVNRLDLQPTNGGLSLSRDPLAYVGTTPLTGNRAAMAILKESDLVLDLMTLLFSPEQHEILASGGRILLAVEPPEVLVRLLPTLQDRERVLAASAVLRAARTMHVVSDAGTDMQCALGDFPILEEYGFCDRPGRWDHWPSGFLATWSNEGSANGVIVLDRGDILLPHKSYIRDPITCTIRNGYVTDISGGLDADLLKSYMDSFRDPEAYALSHVGWGLQDRAHWSVMGFYDSENTIGMDPRAVAGNFLWSTGPNNEAGGTRDTACHIDIPMRNCTVMLDGRPVVEKGRVI
ncbi:MULTISPECIES: 2,5-dihydroxypyridine 5,6-dioxygenase [Novacetimonas]|uniref:2,5-dihydroxypyridine 5,6-dioxygenase n=1 Tax=Novacetimonas hansenii TaxID=436 RepID=A0AAW5ES26_NOVHA|nr:2,5-dihydroxypyridine 5,6-dioxygenase [Novacetimonas hansenii]MBL7235536.1 2,5-dihydroxypyridine 5,6-dioxygenase [Novacetimonas hansenii]MCJ8354309.1 2,5-dihydroxypyridine 5,6-dioxygenase [Novacetimonas hansenii]PYD71963.1 2,5-dihydroxypyridine 5,6-dioxygenase [Novacetimonas hansenii]